MFFDKRGYCLEECLPDVDFIVGLCNKRQIETVTLSNASVFQKNVIFFHCLKDPNGVSGILLLSHDRSCLLFFCFSHF